MRKPLLSQTDLLLDYLVQFRLPTNCTCSAFDSFTVNPSAADNDEHYDTISAFIKSMRGCNLGAALYSPANTRASSREVLLFTRRNT